MKVCIIGNGWYGCHAGMYLLSKNIDIIIVDKSDTFFSGSSSKNQNRLHLGYHYPRSEKTIHECKSGYSKFMKMYSELTNDIYLNMYFIHKNSKVTLDYYCKKFKIKDNYLLDLPFKMNNIIPKYINVEERHIDNIKASNFFEENLHKYFLRMDVSKITYIENKILVNDMTFD